jgi:hypothetical protein
MKSLGRARGHFHFAGRKGYSGVGLYAARKPRQLRTGFGSAEFDAEGRYIEADFGSYTVISLYVPSGSSSDERAQAKVVFMEQFKRHLLELKASGREIILCGDWNVAHKEIDLKNWRSNRRNPGFLPESGSGSPTFSTGWASSTSFAASTTAPGNTPGGAIAARPGSTTSVGGSIIRSPLPVSPRRHGAWRSTGRSGFRTTPR